MWIVDGIRSGLKSGADSVIVSQFLGIWCDCSLVESGGRLVERGNGRTGRMGGEGNRGQTSERFRK